MLVLLLSLIALGLIAFIAGIVRNKMLKEKLNRGEIDEMPHIKQRRPDGCCGKHAVCEKDQLLEAFTQPIEYFDDEELDAYKGREADQYSAEEIEQFEEIMTTMREDEVPSWLHSLQLRGINLPNELKDEAMLFVE